MKTCNQCNITKELHLFYKRAKGSIDGYRKQCTSCMNLYNKINRKDYMREFHKKPEQRAKRRARINVYNKLDGPKNDRRVYAVKYRKNINNKLAHNLRVRLVCAIRKGSPVKDLGCSIDDLKTHLESKFTEGMSWKNYGKWHIDHIIPVSSVDLSNREDFLKICHFSNLQPLWAADNIRKGNKIL